MIELNAPVLYRRAFTDEPGEVPGEEEWPERVRLLEDDEGTWWLEQVHDCEGWKPAGYVPRRQGRWAAWLRNWHHGRLMCYPRRHVLAFCARQLRHGLFRVRG